MQEAVRDTRHVHLSPFAAAMPATVDGPVEEWEVRVDQMLDAETSRKKLQQTDHESEQRSPSQRLSPTSDVCVRRDEQLSSAEAQQLAHTQQECHVTSQRDEREQKQYRGCADDKPNVGRSADGRVEHLCVFVSVRQLTLACIQPDQAQ